MTPYLSPEPQEDLKGVLLAGGNGTRLSPLTTSVSKHLLPLYDKPMLYYSLTNLMLAGARKIAIVTKPVDLTQIKNLLGDGRHLGLHLDYFTQESALGIVDGLLTAAPFIGESRIALALGDNFYHGSGLTMALRDLASQEVGAGVLLKKVSEPDGFGVATIGDDGQITSLVEKPKGLQEGYAVTGLYFMDHTAIKRARRQKPSGRGELEITDLLQTFLNEGSLRHRILPRGTVWKDTGTFEGMFEAASYVNLAQKLTREIIGSPEEVAFGLGWITADQLLESAKTGRFDYGHRLKTIAESSKSRVTSE